MLLLHLFSFLFFNQNGIFIQNFTECFFTAQTRLKIAERAVQGRYVGAAGAQPRPELLQASERPTCQEAVSTSGGQRHQFKVRTSPADRTVGFTSP